MSLALVTIELKSRKNEEEKQSKRKSSNEHKYLSLTSHYLIGIVFGVGRGFDLLFVSYIECYKKSLENDYDVCVITQNVDDLHERAGSKNVIHLHGELSKVC